MPTPVVISDRPALPPRNARAKSATSEGKRDSAHPLAMTAAQVPMLATQIMSVFRQLNFSVCSAQAMLTVVAKEIVVLAMTLVASALRIAPTCLIVVPLAFPVRSLPDHRKGFYVLVKAKCAASILMVIIVGKAMAAAHRIAMRLTQTSTMMRLRFVTPRTTTAMV